MVNRRITRNNLHLYINPEREVDEGAGSLYTDQRVMEPDIIGK